MSNLATTNHIVSLCKNMQGMVYCRPEGSTITMVHGLFFNGQPNPRAIYKVNSYVISCLLDTRACHIPRLDSFMYWLCQNDVDI